MANEGVTFLAAFPNVQAALRVTGDGNGMRIQLDIPENQMAEAVKLMLYRQMVLRVTIEPYGQEQATTDAKDRAAGNRPVKRTTAKLRE